MVLISGHYLPSISNRCTWVPRNEHREERSPTSAISRAKRLDLSDCPSTEVIIRIAAVQLADGEHLVLAKKIPSEFASRCWNDRMGSGGWRNWMIESQIGFWTTWTVGFPD